MAALILPSPQTLLIRRAKTERSSAGKWHFIKPGKDSRVTICGDFITHVYPVDLAMLESIRAADLCDSCWKFEKSDPPAGHVSTHESRIYQPQASENLTA